MKKIILRALVLFALSSCEDKSITPLSDVFFPLAIGNSWTFELAGTDSVIRNRFVEGIEYFDIANDSGHIETFRTENSIVYQLTDTAEVMIFDLSAQEDDTWEYGLGEVKMINRNEIIVINDTLIKNCLRFDFYNPELKDYGHTIWLAPNLGYVQKNCRKCFGATSKTLKLRRAKINNKIIDLEN